MKLWRELSIGERIAVTFMIVLALLLALALFGYLMGGWDDAEAQPLAASKYDKRIAELDREAIDAGYRDKIEALFTTWLSDPTGQPARATKGVQNARRAYIAAMTEIERREAEQRR